MKHKIFLSLVGLTLLGCASDFYYENGKKIELEKLEPTEVQQKIAQNDTLKYYKTVNGHKLAVKNDILVECKEKVNCREVLSFYPLVSIKALSERIFLVEVAKDKNVFEVSQKIYEDSDVKIAHPNFRKAKRRR